MNILQILTAAVCCMLLSGCASWWTDDRPEPESPPYVSVSRKSAVKTDSEVVNEIVSEISLAMAVSSCGPFRVVPAGSLSSLGRQVLDSLMKMNLSRTDGIVVLTLYEKTTGEGTAIFLSESERAKPFYIKHIHWKGGSDGRRVYW